MIHAESRSVAQQRNEGAGRSTGEVLVFLDSELIPAADLVDRYVERLAADDAPDVVLGYSASSTDGGLAAKHDALWWEDHFTAKRDAVTLMFGDFVGTNMAMRRETFERVGPFDTDFEAHDDWDWGVRALQPGSARCSTVTRWPTRARAGVGPHAHRAGTRAGSRRGPALPQARRVVAAGAVRRRAVRIFTALLDQGGAVPAAALLDFLETIHLRRSWLGLFRLAVGTARERGWRRPAGPACQGPTFEPQSPTSTLVSRSRPRARTHRSSSWSARASLRSGDCSRAAASGMVAWQTTPRACWRRRGCQQYVTS